MASTTQAPSKAVITSVGGAIGGGNANSTKPVITGTADAGTIINIYDGVRLLGSTTVAANGTWSYTPTADLKGGTHAFTVISVDSQGNWGASSEPMSVAVGSSAPAAPVITGATDAVGPIQGLIPANGTTDDPRPTFNGTGRAGDLIKLYDGSTLIGSATADGSGKWTIKPTTDLSNGAHSITATDTNTGGTVSPASTPLAFTVDTTVPAAPAISSVMDNVGTIKGAIVAGGVTDDARPVVNGTGKAGDVIKLYDGATLIGSATVGSDGKWSIQPANALSNAAHDLSATDTNAVGTTSPASAHFGFTVDTTTPATPAAPVITDNGMTIPSGGTMPDGHPVISGTGKAGDTVKIYDGSTVIGSTTIGGDGKWSFKPSTDLSAGAHDLSVIETNPAGTSSAASAHTTFTVALFAPVITSIVDTVGPIQGTIPNGGTTDDNHPTISGTGIPGATVNIYQNDTGCGAAIVDATGHWSVKISGAMSEGLHNMTAKQIVGGQTSAASNTWAITIDTSVPVAPVISSVMDNVGTIKGAIVAGSVTDDARPVVNGTGKAGDVIKLYDGSTLIGSATVGGDGKWSVQPANALSNAAHDLSATDTNAVGTTSPASAHFGFTVDTTTPATPAAPVITDNGSLVPNGGTMPDGHPVISGTGKAGDTVKIYDGSTVIGSTTIGGDGKWSFKPSTDLSAGAHDLSVVETNPAGTSSAPSAHTTFMVVVPVPAPVILNVWPAAGDMIPNGGTTNDPRPQIVGNGVPGDTVYVYANGRGVGDTVVGSGGIWQVTLKQDIDPGLYRFTATQFASGQTQSAASNTWTITVSTSVPAAPVISSVVDNVGTIKGAIAQGSMTDDPRPVVNGTGRAGDVVKLYDGSTLIGSATVASNGTWSIQPANALSNATHDLSATDTNAVGTTSPASAHFGFTVNTTTPATPAAPGITDNGMTIPYGGTMPDGHPWITGTGTSGDTIKVYDNGNLIGSTTISGNGQWSFKPSADLSNGAHSISVIETNPAGTSSSQSAAIYVTVNVIYAPTSTVYISNLIDDTSGSNVSISNGGSTRDTTPQVQGTVSQGLRSGDSLVVYRDGVKIGNAAVNGTNWSYQDSGVAVGSHSYTAQVENTAGRSNPSNSFAFTLAPVSVGARIKTDVRFSGGVNYTDYYVDFGTASQPLNSYVTYRTWPPVGYEIRVNFTQVAGTTIYKATFAAVTGNNLGTILYVGDVVVDRSIAFGYDWRNPVIGALNAVRQNVVADEPTTVHAEAIMVATVASYQDRSEPERHTAVGEHDAFKGVAGGNETVDLNADPASYFKEATAHIEGAKGGAVDTLHLTGDHQILDLTSLTGKTAAAKISGIEVIDLGGHENTLKLSLVDVLNLGEVDLFQQDGKQQLMVNGKEGDMVDLSNSHIAGLAEGEWEQHGTTQVGGVTYNVYEHSGVHTELLVQQGVQIVVH